jgi:hypothetical protein
MFFEDVPSETQFAIYPQASFVQSYADVVKKGLASPGSVFTFPVLMSTRIGQTPLGKFNLTANLAYNASTKDDTASFLSASVGHSQIASDTLDHSYALAGVRLLAGGR